MAQYIVTSPDGMKYRITAPDDATPEQVQAFAQHAQPAQSNPLSDAYRQAFLAGNTVKAHQIAVQARQQGTPIAPVSSTDINSSVDQRFNQSVQDEPILQRLVEGIGQGANSVNAGIRQHVVDPLRDFADGGNRTAADAALVARDRQLSAPLNATASGQIGNVVGTTAASAPLMLVPGGGETLPARLAAGALAGAGYGYVAPSASEGEHILNTLIGAGLAAGVPGAVKVGQLAGRGGKAIVQHFTNPGAVADRIVASRLGNDPAAAAAIRNYSTAVAGERPTLAQVLQTPKAVQLERAARSNPVSGPDIVAQDNANNATRMGTIERHAGNETVGSMLDQSPMDAMTAATETRRANAAPFMANNIDYLTPGERWGSAAKALASATGRMSGADRDAVQQAQRIAQKVRSGQMQEDEAAQELGHLGASVTSQAAQKAFHDAAQATTARMTSASKILDSVARARNTGLGQNPTVSKALNEITDRINKATDTRGLVPLDVLDGIQKNMRGILEANKPSPFASVGSAEAAGIAPLQAHILDTLRTAVPGYGNYAARYAEQSVPVNTAQTVRQFLSPDTVRSLNSSGDRQATATAVSRLLKDVHGSQYGISPMAERDLSNAQKSLLDRSVVDQKIGAAGSNTDADAQNRLIRALARHGGSATGGATIGALVGGPIGAGLGSLAGLGIDFADQAAQRRIAAALGQRVMNPELAANAIDSRLALLAGRQAFNNRLVPTYLGGGVLGYGAGVIPQFLRINASPPPVSPLLGGP